VLTLKFTNGSRPGRVRYQTFDGTARAPEDYTALSDEVIFTGSEAMMIRIPVVDDDLAEGTEDFTVRAWEEPPPADPWPQGPSTATVRIIEDDQKRTPVSSTSPGRSGQQASASEPRSSSGRPSTPSAVPASPGAAAAADRPGESNVAEPARPSDPVVHDETEPLFNRAEPKDKRHSALPAALGTLLVVTIAAAELGLKRRLRRS
jgi:hypothetical protein